VASLTAKPQKTPRKNCFEKLGTLDELPFADFYALNFARESL
jgi:hypothetical protein